MTLNFLLAGVCFLSQIVQAQVLQQQLFKTHLRLNLFAQKGMVNIRTIDNKIIIRSLNPDMIKKISEQFKTIKNSKYIKKQEFVSSYNNTSIAALIVYLSDKTQTFDFYKDREKKYVLDLWVEKDDDFLNQKVSKTKTTKKAVTSVKKKTIKRKVLPKKKVVAKKVLKKKETNIRDFRYGVPFLWNYRPVAPRLAGMINLDSKTPEYFYPIKDRDIEKNELEAHIQLTINLFRKKKWGLMYKSIKLFNDKYGELAEKYSDINDYIKANAILRSNIVEKDKKPIKMAVNILTNVSERTNNYDLKKGILKYLIAYYIHNKETIRSLQKAKKLYIVSKEAFDYEQSEEATKIILNNLAKLKQVNKINEFVSDKTIAKIINAQTRLAYKIYALISTDDTKEVLRVFAKETKNKKLSKPIEPSILYNLAEANFREANYDEALKLYDEFLKEASFYTESSNARLRIAMIYDLKDKNFKEVKELYKSAINKSTDQVIRYESSIRYVALSSIRNKKPTKKEIEERVFLENETITLTKEMKKALWITRLRTFIVDEKYQDALTYLAAIPLNSLTPFEKRVFEGDGAEIVYGLLLNKFKKGNYAEVIKIWETYRNTYISKVAGNPFLNFAVAKSYASLGMWDDVSKIYKIIQKLQDTPDLTYPNWVERERFIDSSQLLVELDVIRNIHFKNFDLAKKQIQKLKEIKNDWNRSNYYLGLIGYKLNDYNEAAKNFEIYLSSQKGNTLYDLNEVASMLNAYADSLYQLNDINRFKRVVTALSEDLNAVDGTTYFKEVKERIQYLYLEVLFSGSKDSERILSEAKSNDFLKQFKKSQYTDRIRYINGVSKVKNGKKEEGKKVLLELINDNNVDKRIKELSRSELSLLNINERILRP